MSTLRDRALGAAILLLAAASRLPAQTATAGNEVTTTHLGNELNPTVIADGAGGAFVAFKLPYRSAVLPAEIVVAHVLPSAAPHPEWFALPMTPLGSLPQGTPPGPTHAPIAPSGRALAFADYANATGTVDLIREVGANGAEPSYPGFKPTYAYTVLTALPRSDGGALVLSKATGENINCLATVVAPNGTGTEVLNVINVGNGTFATAPSDRIAAVPSGTDGALAVLQLPQITSTFTGTDLVATRIDATGHATWIPSHRVVTSATRDQYEVVAATDGADGSIFVWRDLRTIATGSDIYGMRLLPTGALATGWTAGGKALCAVAGEQSSPAIVSDDAGGAWLAWVDGRVMDDAGEIFYTHVLGNGTIAAGFPVGGKALCAAPGTQSSVQLARDGSGGCFAVWLDARDGETDLYGQHFNAAGNATGSWLANGSPLCTDPTEQGSLAIEKVSTGRAIVAWNDTRSGSFRVYSLLLDASFVSLDAPPAGHAALALAARANPARGAVELRLDALDEGDVRVTLYDVSGRALAERTVSGPARRADVRFDRLPPGLYFAVAGQRGAVASTRVAVVR